MEDNSDVKILAFKVHKSLVFKLKFQGLKQCFRTFPLGCPLNPNLYDPVGGTAARENRPLLRKWHQSATFSSPVGEGVNHTMQKHVMPTFPLASSLCKAPSNLEKRIQSKGTHLKNQLPALCLPWLEKDSGYMILESAI